MSSPPPQPNTMPSPGQRRYRGPWPATRSFGCRRRTGIAAAVRSRCPTYRCQFLLFSRIPTVPNEPEPPDRRSRNGGPTSVEWRAGKEGSTPPVKAKAVHPTTGRSSTRARGAGSESESSALGCSRPRPRLPENRKGDPLRRDLWRRPALRPPTPRETQAPPREEWDVPCCPKPGRSHARDGRCSRGATHEPTSGNDVAESSSQPCSSESSPLPWCWRPSSGGWATTPPREGRGHRVFPLRSFFAPPKLARTSAAAVLSPPHSLVVAPTAERSPFRLPEAAAAIIEFMVSRSRGPRLADPTAAFELRRTSSGPEAGSGWSSTSTEHASVSLWSRPTCAPPSRTRTPSAR